MQTKLRRISANEEYTSGESSVDEGKQVFRDMDQNSKNEHMVDMWKLCYLRCVAATKICKMFDLLHERVILFGTIKNVSKN